MHTSPEPASRAWRARTRGGERGAVIVEAALILPVFFLLVFGILEIGGVLKSYSSVANGVRAGGRMASVAGNDAMADQMILERLEREVAGVGNGEIEYVVVWHATGTGTQPPAECLRTVPAGPNTTSQGRTVTASPGSCNIYFLPTAPGGAFDMAAGRAAQPPDYYFGCSSATPAGERSHKLDCFWPGKDRKVTNSPRGATPVQRPDFVGVYVRAEHTYYTGVLGTSLTITDAGINLIEPQGYALTTP